MKKLKIKYSLIVPPNKRGLMFVKSVFAKTLDPGVYNFYFVDPDYYLLVLFPSELYEVSLLHQELLTKDYITFRLSLVVEYIVTDMKMASSLMNLQFTDDGWIDAMQQLNMKVWQEAQIVFKSKLCQLESNDILENYSKLDATDEELREIEKNLKGITVKKVRVKEVSFPKMIQEMFAKLLDAKVRAKADLENARTLISSARAMKNVSSMINDDPGLQYLMYLESIRELASRGKNNTFFVGHSSETLTKHGSLEIKK